LNPDGCTGATSYNNRGNAWASKKEYDKAIADFNEAIRLDPQYANAYNNRGLTWVDKKEYDKAIADYDEAIRHSPTSVKFHRNRHLGLEAQEESNRPATVVLPSENSSERLFSTDRREDNSFHGIPMSVTTAFQVPTQVACSYFLMP